MVWAEHFRAINMNTRCASLLSTFSPPSPLIIQTKSKDQKISPASDNLHFWGKGRLRKRSANHTSLDKFGVAKCWTTFPTFPCQCNSVHFEAALLSGLCGSNIFPLFQDMSGDARGMRSMLGLKNVPQVPQAAVCWWSALLLRKLISTHDLDRACLLAFEKKWLKPGNTFVCYRGNFSLLFPTIMRDYLDPQNFWVSDGRKYVWLLVLSSHFPSGWEWDTHLVRMSSPFWQTYAKGTRIGV